MTRLILIRHGETAWNVEGRYQGQADPPLNERGVQQAHELVAELRSVAPGVLYSSPLRRAWQTAKILAKALQIPLNAEERLMEIHQGEWQGILRREIETRFPDLIQQWESNPWNVSPPGGERLSEVQSRVYRAVDEILEWNQGQVIGMITHRIPIALVKMRYQALDRDELRTLRLPNAYYEVLAVKNQS